MNIYVGNLSWSMTDDDLMNLFTQYGSVTSAKILKDKMNGRSKGFGFVEMEDDEAARTAISNLNETEVLGRKLIVNAIIVITQHVLIQQLQTLLICMS